MEERGGGGWKAEFLEELEESARRRRWGLALMIVGWLHLAGFGMCQWIYRAGVRVDGRHPMLWFGEFGCLLVVFRVVSGRGWWRDSAAAGLVVRIWGTFLILTFNLATYNTMTGWDLDWFKPVWTTLSTFGFASMAWLIDLRFLILAVQMYLTGLLMIQLPYYNYIIYGVSWCGALQAVGGWLEWRRQRATEAVRSGEAARAELAEARS